MRARSLLVLLVLSACKTSDPLYCDEDTPCTDPDRPYCDLTGEYPASEGHGRTCIPDPDPDALCEASEFLRCDGEETAVYCSEDGMEEVEVACDAGCDAGEGGCFCPPDTSMCAGDTTLHCGSDGQVAEVQECPLGCEDDTRCTDVNPSNGLSDALDMAADGPDLVIPDGAVISSNGTIEVGEESIDAPSMLIDGPADGVDIRVFWVRSLVVGDATTSGSGAVAFVSHGDITVTGLIEVEGGVGPSVGLCTGNKGSCESGDTDCAGSGGGGFGSAGGKGGDSASNTGAAPGDPIGTVELVPLRGGCDGGDGWLTGNEPFEYEVNGPGGGAVQLVSRTAIRVEQGFIAASGRAPTAGPTPLTTFDYLAPGGGSGGGILLEAPVVEIAAGAGVVANGGGGGGGCGQRGDDGHLSDIPALGGQCTTNGDGGEGAAGSEDANDGDGGSQAAGGGGGGAGRIRINTDTGGFIVDEAGIVSPTPSIGQIGVR